MTDSELQVRLKSVRVPDRPDEYWEDFPSHIRVQLRRERQEFTPLRAGHPRLAWAGGLALAMTLVFVALELHPIQSVSRALAEKHQQFHAHIARLDAGLHKLMLNTDGMGYLLAEAN